MATDPESGYEPQPSSFPSPQKDTSTTVIVQQPTQQFKDFPVTLPDGNTTVLRYKAGLLTWIFAAAICFFTGLCCIAVIPFCIDSCKDVEHVNPATGEVVGVYKRM